LFGPEDVACGDFRKPVAGAPQLQGGFAAKQGSEIPTKSSRGTRRLEIITAYHRPASRVQGGGTPPMLLHRSGTPHVAGERSSRRTASGSEKLAQ